MPIDEKPIDAVKPTDTDYDVDEFDAADDADDAGEVEGDEGTAESSLLDGIDDVIDDDGDDAPAEGKQAPDKSDPALSVVPKTADGYQIPKIAGLELTEADKPALSGFMAHAHRLGAPQSTINAGLSYLAELKTTQLKMDVVTAKATKAELLAELGDDGFKAEAGRLKHMLRSMPDSLGDDIRDARLPDGRRLINDPRFFRWASNQNARTRVRTPTDRIREIERVMKKDIHEYHRLGLSDELGRLLAEKEGSR